ncbi:galactosylceramide sulfotransferase-like isoform X1 [Biomphalaria glabrata]|uniref:Galactosylceramide sulfotransferase-like isoform X1 n=1 Tax=Biomphalaria glabrata TaxID=6526 RepID=A0A9W2ZFA7_BIOGL|nr:galactosylceramide sulfotransferase-like isoform X1 [Biomphalaria glabrata]
MSFIRLFYYIFTKLWKPNGRRNIGKQKEMLLEIEKDSRDLRSCLLRTSCRRTLLVVLALSSLAISVAILKSQLQVHAFRITPFETLKVSTPLRQKPSPRASTCPPAKNVVFIKTHKTGSSTVANIIFRYGLVRKLNFALPNRAIFQRLLNHISIPGEVMTEDCIYPIPDGQEYNIVTHHAVYNRTFFQQIMPKNSTYITILREPFSHLKSAYEYYKIEKYFVAKAPGTFDPSNPISSFLKDPYFYSSNGTNFTIIRNSQSADLGIREEHLETTRFQEYLETLDKDFSLVMILEYFDESLLMLKRLLCWELKDILYIPMNENSRKRILPYTEEDRMLYKEFSPLDHALYSFFRSKFASMLKSQNKEFFDELNHFKSLLKEVRFNCMFGNTLVVKATQWHSEFEFTGEDCRLANMNLRDAVGMLYGQSFTHQYKNESKIVFRSEGYVI